jgi:hypothetical protein
MSTADTERDYYHINRAVSWSPYSLLSDGDEVDVGGSSNPFFRLFETARVEYDVNVGDGSAAQVPGIRFLQLARAGEITGLTMQGLAAIADEVSRHFVRYVRELIWEDVRRREFPHLPSRQRCVWLIQNQDGVRYWLGRMNAGGAFQVLRVRVQGRIHVASESYLLGDSEPMEETIRKARQYWLGVVEQEGTEEVIFEGRMRVVEVMPTAFYS